MSQSNTRIQWINGLKGIPLTTVILSVFLVAVPVQILVTFLFQKITVPVTNMIAKAVGGNSSKNS